MEYKKIIRGEDVEVINYEGVDITASNSDFLMSFNINLETREWGIKSICVYNIKVLSGSVFLTKDNYPEPDTETEIDCKDFEVIEEVKINSDDITVHALEIDVKNKIITVT